MLMPHSSLFPLAGTAVLAAAVGVVAAVGPVLGLWVATEAAVDRVALVVEAATVAISKSLHVLAKCQS
jgi:hypothetical protein